MQDSNKRQLKRVHLIYYLRIFDNNSGNNIGHLVDITTQGIMMISEKPIPAGQDAASCGSGTVPGGPRGLQTRWDAPGAFGGFDSHPLPPDCRRLSQPHFQVIVGNEA